MKTTIRILLFFLLLIGSCTKEGTEFCKDCKVNEQVEYYVDHYEGWICFSEQLERYIICTPHYNISYNFCPCEFPSYFAIEENLPVIFAGYKAESPIFKTVFGEITCIRLDTIFHYTE